MDELSKGRALKNKINEEERPEPEARAIDVKIKGAENESAKLVGNLALLKQMQEEKWKTFDWVDAEVGCSGWLLMPRCIMLGVLICCALDRGIMVHI